MPDPSVVIIEEIAGPKRKVELYGAGLPFRGADWGGQQRISTTWYPGNSIDATQQVLGPIELPSDWQGEWRTTRLVSSPCLFYPEGGGSPIKVSKASTLRDVLEDMFRGAAKLRVTWAQGARKVVREGLAEEWHFPTDRMDDIGWSVTWAWSGRGGKQNRVVTLRGDKLNDQFRAAIASANELVALVETAKMKQHTKGVPLSADTFSLGDLEALANAPGDLMKQVSQFANNVVSRVNKLADIVKTVATTPASLASQALDIASNATATFNQIVDSMSREVPDAYTKLDTKASSLTKMAAYVGGAQTQAEVVAATMARFEREVRKKQSGLVTGGRKGDRATTRDILTTHISKQGETFASIAKLYYKTTDRAAELANANGFPGYQVAPPPGTPLIVPTLGALDARNKV